MDGFLVFMAFVIIACVGYGVYWKLFKEKNNAELNSETTEKRRYSITAEIRTNAPSKQYPHIKGVWQSKIAGVTFPNDDGSGRQEILNRCQVGEDLVLTNTPIPEDKNAVKVSRLNGEQIGWLHKWNADEIAPILRRGEVVEAAISDLADFVNDEGEQIRSCKIILALPGTRPELERYALEKVTDMRNKGIITEEEFLRKKKQILS